LISAGTSVKPAGGSRSSLSAISNCASSNGRNRSHRRSWIKPFWRSGWSYSPRARGMGIGRIPRRRTCCGSSQPLLWMTASAAHFFKKPQTCVPFSSCRHSHVPRRKATTSAGAYIAGRESTKCRIRIASVLPPPAPTDHWPVMSRRRVGNRLQTEHESLRQHDNRATTHQGHAHLRRS
jgi:hypothetical protein